MNKLDDFLANLAGVLMAVVLISAINWAAGGTAIFAKPLARAIELGQQVRVERLLERGASANTKLTFYRLYSRPIQAERNDFDPLVIDDQFVQMTPLMLATFFNHPGIVELLIKYGADVHAEAADGSTAMRIAYSYNRREIREILKKAGALLQDSLRLKPLRSRQQSHETDGTKVKQPRLFRPSG